MTVGPKGPMQIGDPVDDFTLIDDQGQPWALSGHDGIVLLIFHRHLM